MPPAIATHTRNPLSDTICVALTFTGNAEQSNSRAFQERRLLSVACREAAVTHGAMTALTLSVADVPQDDPRQTAMATAVGLLLPRWHEQIARVCRLPAADPADLQVKAALLSSLIDRDGLNSAVGGPAVQLAASLADDVLTQDWGEAG